MPIRKKGDIDIRTSANGTKVKQTGYTFYSYDKNAAALYFQFREQDGQPTDLSKATVHLVMILNDDGGKEFIPKSDEIEVLSAIRGTAKYVLPEMLLSYSGKVTGYVYMDFDDGSQSDDGQFTFRIKHSMITHVLPEAGDKYVQDFEDVKERVEQAGDSATKDIEKAKDNAESQIGDYVGEVESAKDSAVEDIDKALSEDLLDEAKNYTDDKVEGFNETITKQLAQKADDYAVRKRTEPITLNDMDESALNAIAGGENTNLTIEDVPRDFSVGPDKTTFARTGINKFDGIYKRYSLRTDGTIGDVDTARSAIVRITGGKTYHFRKHGGDRMRLAFHKTEPIPTEESLDYYVGNITPGVGYAAPEDANYAVYYVSNASETPNAQITEGKDYPFFVGYDVNINLENKSQTLDLLEEGDRIRDVLSLQRAYLYSTDIQVKIDYKLKLESSKIQFIP
ncbi:phage baseplate upper protein [Tetragenococcus halophilus]|uniref:BppU N-terminal domain-containing protein n=1 Tax=Tetragenococcus halophilus (strain DSM 20338 / JCM 20259 / NCIMB 9735 / NBRC 12172) TaxID=945021 RepID=A0AAN1SFS4_TETHN|nr:phage baseplate upper protein [Tetragenococcus halophilus]BAK94209.1 hypothetical protein TEH_08820 [Tetragenococcus halophilus NBRC 12172]GBD70742.1 putative uncharacterized protein [Tetragenococcus halophilus subsp. halophilus]